MITSEVVEKLRDTLSSLVKECEFIVSVTECQSLEKAVTEARKVLTETEDF